MDDERRRMVNEKTPGGCTGSGFQPGKSGNPGGRPKGAVSLTTILRKKLTECDADTLAQNLLDLALKLPKPRTVNVKGGGSYEAIDPVEAKMHQWAVDTLLDRIDGRVAIPIRGEDKPLVRFIIDPGKSLTAPESD